MNLRIATNICLILFLSWTAVEAEPLSKRQLKRLTSDIEKLSADAEGIVGVGIHHIESGTELYLNGDEPFPMASTYKVPIAVQLFHRAEAGEIDLDEMIPFRDEDKHPGSGLLQSRFIHPGLSMSIMNYYELMLVLSDNSATDIVLSAAGGGEQVTARMRELGLDSIRVDRPTAGLISDFIGIERRDGEPAPNQDRFIELYKETTGESRRRAAIVFDDDPRDTATPRDMTELIIRIWTDAVLTPESCAQIRETMGRCETGERRLQAGLPISAELAHKTGTIGSVTNDVGVVTLPDNGGDLVIVVFVSRSTMPIPEREDVIAAIAEITYRYFTKP